MRRPQLLLGVFVITATVSLLGTLLAAPAAPTAAQTAVKTAATTTGRYVVVASSDADYAALRDQASRAGARVHELHGTRTLAVEATADVARKLEASSLSAFVVRDRVEKLIDPQWRGANGKPQLSRDHAIPVGSPPNAPQDPASGLDGLMWNQSRIRSPQANAVTSGSRAVTVAVADTGLDFTHSELKSKISANVDFTATENPPICKSTTGYSDADLAAESGGPENTDRNGHGSWIGGNIAAALDDVGINGIAPGVNLVGLKISQWCGLTYESEILAAFEYAAAQRYDVVSISFGGYLDRRDPEQDAIYQQYVRVVADARKAGTLIIAAAGNEHLRIGAGGQVLSHGPLATPGTTVQEFTDYFGFYEVPGGIPGVVDVSSTGNVVAPSSANCPQQTGTAISCKPTADAHQAAGSGKQDQLAYYSNYGPRIDVAGPGGARKFNLPVWDGGGTPGFPVTADDGYTAYGEFSITSNWASGVPCFTFPGPTFPAGECYSTIQGTSMATPHVSAVAALIASAKPGLRHRPEAILEVLKDSARDGAVNLTQPLSATDTSPSDLTGVACPTGYCHLGGEPISNREAYGEGIVDALRGVR
jgi:subtilisin family serine protease